SPQCTEVGGTMTDTEERIARLEGRVASLESRLAEHENMRSGAIDALHLMQGNVERLQRRMSATVPPAVDAAREISWLEQISIVKTRLRALEEWLQEETQIVVGHHDGIREILALLKHDGE